MPLICAAGLGPARGSFAVLGALPACGCPEISPSRSAAVAKTEKPNMQYTPHVGARKSPARQPASTLFKFYNPQPLRYSTPAAEAPVTTAHVRSSTPAPRSGSDSSCFRVIQTCARLTGLGKVTFRRSGIGPSTVVLRASASYTSAKKP